MRMKEAFVIGVLALAACLFVHVPNVAAAPDLTDSDADGLPDLWEVALGTDSMQIDSDGDGYKDGIEVLHGYDPLNPKPVKVEKLIRVSEKDMKLTFEVAGKRLMEMPVSTGKASTPTPKGTFAVIQKMPFKWYKGPTWDYPNTKWNMHFTTKNGLRYYIHGAYWHDKFGVAKVSGGCVNVRYEDMEALYNWSNVGTKVIVS